MGARYVCGLRCRAGGVCCLQRWLDYTLLNVDALGIVRTFKIDRIASWSRVGELARSRSARSFNRSSDRWPGRDCLNASLSRDSVCRKESASCDI